MVADDGYWQGAKISHRKANSRRFYANWDIWLCRMGRVTAKTKRSLLDNIMCQGYISCHTSTVYLHRHSPSYWDTLSVESTQIRWDTWVWATKLGEPPPAPALQKHSRFLRTLSQSGRDSQACWLEPRNRYRVPLLGFELCTQWSNHVELPLRPKGMIYGNFYCVGREQTVDSRRDKNERAANVQTAECRKRLSISNGAQTRFVGHYCQTAYGTS